MAKDPAFLFYPNDWLGGTLGMTFEEKGAYMELLMLQFNRGHMTKDMIGQTVGHLWVKLEDKFRMDEDGLWYNERLELEKEKRKRFVSSRVNNKKGKNQYSHMNGHMTSHMENENCIGINTKRVGDFYKDGAEAFEEIKSDEIMVERLVRTVHNSGFKTATALQVMTAVRHFITKESAKPEFFYRPRDAIKSHLVNWIAQNAKKLTDYA